MGGVAFLFAGQGAQRPGMGAALAKAEPVAAAVFAQADALRPGTSALCFDGTAEELRATEATQPCVFAVDLACARALAAHGVKPDFVAGFSLGEVAALTFAGAFSDADGFSLVCERGRLMARACEEHPGGMRAVLKLDAHTVEGLAREAGCWAANHNSPRQTVVAGEVQALARMEALVSAAGGRTLPVAVAGPFHTPLMDAATAGLGDLLSSSYVPAPPRVPVVANVTARPYSTDAGLDGAAERAMLLALQASSPVRWTETLEYLAAQGVDTFIEVGPGAALTGFVRRTLSDVRALSVETPEQLEEVVRSVAGQRGLTGAQGDGGGHV